MSKKIFLVLTLISLFDELHTMELGSDLSKSSASISKTDGAPTPPLIEESLFSSESDPIVPYMEQTKSLLYHDMFESVVGMTETIANEERREYYKWRYLQLSQHQLASTVLRIVEHQMGKVTEDLHGRSSESRDKDQTR